MPLFKKEGNLPRHPHWPELWHTPIPALIICKRNGTLIIESDQRRFSLRPGRSFVTYCVIFEKLLIFSVSQLILEMSIRKSSANLIGLFFHRKDSQKQTILFIPNLQEILISFAYGALGQCDKLSQENVFKTE